MDRNFREKATAKTVKGRPQLEKAIDALDTGDELVIAEWDRATRSMMDGSTIIQRVVDTDAAVFARIDDSGESFYIELDTTLNH